jgi:hypothetical protein
LELVQPPFSNLSYVWKQTFHPLHMVNQPKASGFLQVPVSTKH